MLLVTLLRFDCSAIYEAYFLDKTSCSFNNIILNVLLYSVSLSPFILQNHFFVIFSKSRALFNTNVHTNKTTHNCIIWLNTNAIVIWTKVSKNFTSSEAKLHILWLHFLSFTAAEQIVIYKKRWSEYVRNARALVLTFSFFLFPHFSLIQRCIHSGTDDALLCYRNFDIKCRHFAGCLHLVH